MALFPFDRLAPVRNKLTNAKETRRKRFSHSRGGWPGFEPLESRNMLAVTLNPINNIQEPGGKDVLVPLTGLDDANTAINYSFQSSDSNVSLSLVSPTSQSLVLNVTGKDAQGQDFSGQLIIHLFEDLAPNTTAQLKNLVNGGLYNGSTFARVLDGFVAQNTADSTTTGKLNDEFNTSMTFTSPGLLSMANAGSDTANSEFFITATNEKNSTTPIALADMPQFLDFKFTILGQLVSGFDTFEKIMTTPVKFSSTYNETSSPISTVTVTSASLITDIHDAVLRVSAPASFNGNSATITVTATDTAQSTTQQQFQVSVLANPYTQTTDPPFINDTSIKNLTTTTNTAVNFTISASDPANGGVAYLILDPATGKAPTNVTLDINQSIGKVTLTPATGFTGTIPLLAAVRAISAPNQQSSYDTQGFTLTVSAVQQAAPTVPSGLTLDTASDTGNFSNDNFTSLDTPTLHATADAGDTVKFNVNGTTVPATEGAAGQYSATVPAGTLAVGANAVTASATNTTGTSADSTPLSLTYAPSYAQVYTVPGAAGSAQQLTINWSSKNAVFNDELGVYTADSADGTVGGVAPGSANYVQAGIGGASGHVLFTSGQGAGASTTLNVQGGQLLVFYLVQNNTTANLIANNPTDQLSDGMITKPMAFFSANAANPDETQHVQAIADPTTGLVQYNWEDQSGGGDSDFNDASISVSVTGGTSNTPSAVLAPGAGSSNTLNLNATLQSGTNLSATAGDVGIYFVDDPSGKIGNLKPGDSAYAIAALAGTNSKALAGPGVAAGTEKSVTVPAGKYIAFYAISSGTTLNMLMTNANNNPNTGPVAFFSFDAANPSQVNHFRWISPEAVATNPSQLNLHIMEEVFGNASNYDDLALALNWTTG